MPNNWIVDDIHELANDILLQSQGGDVFPDMSGYVGVYNTGNGLLAFASGNPVTISNAKNENAVNVTATLEPIQDLHGYDHPWAGGAGKNLANLSEVTGGTVTGESVTVQGGTASYQAAYILMNLKGGTTYTFSARATRVDDIARISFRNVNNNQNVAVSEMVTSAGNLSVSYTPPIDEDMRLSLFCTYGTANPSVATVYEDIQLEVGSEPTAYEPYSNICPISGRTQVEITNKDSEDAVLDSVTVNLGQTVYGGTLDVTTGELSVETANIASYNGESIGEPWWSSMDEYVAGTLPTTGAQVVYTIATPITVSLTPAQIQLLTTTNIISTSADDLEVTYKIRS